MQFDTAVSTSGYVAMQPGEEFEIRWPFKLLGWRVTMIEVFPGHCEFHCHRRVGPFLFRRAAKYPFPPNWSKFPRMPERVRSAFLRLRHEVNTKNDYLQLQYVKWVASDKPAHPLFTEAHACSVPVR